jgi:hypothetical protein
MLAPTQLATRKLLTAGQARAQRLIDRIESQTTGSAILEIGALRAMVRNLCAEVAAFECDDDTIYIEFNGRPYGVMLTPDGDFDYAQIAGIDVTDLLPFKARQDMTTLALNARRQKRIDDAWDARQDALAQEQAA